MTEVGISFNLFPFLGLSAAISCETSSVVVSCSENECNTVLVAIECGMSGSLSASVLPMLAK